jgi:F-type H+-transporting ATPase subunit delta
MKDRKLAVRYARALHGAFPDTAQSEPIDRFLAALGESMTDSDELSEMLIDPAVPRHVRSRVLVSLAEHAGLPAGVGNFLRTVVDNHRTAALPSIAAVFHELREQKLGIVAAEITTAAPLDDAQEQRALAALQKLTGSDVRLTCKVEPRLMGGAMTRVGSTVYDGTLRMQLDRLRRKMAQE